MLKKLGVGSLAMMIAMSFLLGWDCSCLVYAAETSIIQTAHQEAVKPHCPMKHGGSEDPNEQPAKHDCQHCYAEKQARLVKPEPVDAFAKQLAQVLPFVTVERQSTQVSHTNFSQILLDISPQFFADFVVTKTYSPHAPPAF